MKNIKTLLTIVILVLALLTLLAISSETELPMFFNETIIIFILIFTVIVIFTQFIIYKQTRVASAIQPITKVICQNCKYSEKRTFQAGDYVFKNQGLCMKCGGKMIIEAIYLSPKTKDGTG
ncbi:MAG: hypothetical protein QXP91_10125 [Candidatus Methanomethylicia archaeon]